MCKSILLFFLLIGFGKQLCAQTNAVSAAINALHAVKQGKNFDTALFVKYADTLAYLTFEPKDITAINTVAESFDNGTDKDYNIYIRYWVLVSLTKLDVYAAIDYARQNLELVNNNKGANHAFLRLYYLTLLRIPYRNSSRITEGFSYYNKLLTKSKAAGDTLSTMFSYYVLSGFYRTVGLYDASIYHLRKATAMLDTSDRKQTSFLSLKNQLKGINAYATFTGVLGEYYYLKGEFKNSLQYSRLSYQVYQANKALFGGMNHSYSLKNMASAMINLNELDSAAYYLDEAKKYFGSNDFAVKGTAMQIRALLYLKKGDTEKAEGVLLDCSKLIQKNKMLAFTPQGVVGPDYYLALVKIAQHKLSEAIQLLNSDLERIKSVRMDVLRDYKLLGALYDSIGNQQMAKASYVRYISLQDSLQSDQSKFRSLSFETEQMISDNETAILKLETANKLSAQSRNFIIGIAVLLLILAATIYYRFQTKKKDNIILEKTLIHLKSTQTQLIQSEKMASLGELTAGIAHEIQNPLNFVNNFSEVSNELIAEMNEELDKGEIAEAKIIASDISNNLEKINHHGKRADAIVKGMLQHSRQSSGAKEPTDINALADEYLRMSYHGLRAKDKMFNATLNTSYDPSIGNISIIPQDIGRVLLNLFNNAFYAVAEKQNTAADGYQPTVSISTKKNGDTIELMVSDNGNGIPAAIKEKIFQPFFTTKPTGQGTGLGLSLSYDIVKAHGGEIKVETKDYEGTIFIIQLPI